MFSLFVFTIPVLILLFYSISFLIKKWAGKDLGPVSTTALALTLSLLSLVGCFIVSRDVNIAWAIYTRVKNYELHLLITIACIIAIGFFVSNLAPSRRTNTKENLFMLAALIIVLIATLGSWSYL